MTRASSILLPTIILSLINCTIPASINNTNNTTSIFMSCSPFTCGNISFPFPFSSSLSFGLGPQDCGLPGYQIACDDYVKPSSLSVAGIVLSGRLYQIKNLYLSERLITVVDTDLIKDLMAGSCISFHNFTVISSSSYVLPLSLPFSRLFEKEF